MHLSLDHWPALHQLCFLSYFQNHRLQELKMDMSLFQYRLLPQTTHGIFHFTEETTGQFKISGMWLNRDCSVTLLLFQSGHTWKISSGTDSLYQNFKTPFGCYVETGKNNDKLYYSINLSSSKQIIFFDTVHSSVRVRSWRQNNRIPLIVSGRFVWISLHSVIYYVSFQKSKFEFYTDRFCKTVHECKDTKKWPEPQPKKPFNMQLIFRKQLSVYCKSRFLN